MLTVELSAVTGWKYDARILRIAISAVSSDSVRQNAACDTKAAVVVVLNFRFAGHSRNGIMKWSCRTEIQSLLCTWNDR